MCSSEAYRCPRGGWRCTPSTTVCPLPAPALALPWPSLSPGDPQPPPALSRGRAPPRVTRVPLPCRVPPPCPAPALEAWRAVPGAGAEGTVACSPAALTRGGREPAPVSRVTGVWRSPGTPGAAKGGGRTAEVCSPSHPWGRGSCPSAAGGGCGDPPVLPCQRGAVGGGGGVGGCRSLPPARVIREGRGPRSYEGGREGLRRCTCPTHCQPNFIRGPEPPPHRLQFTPCVWGD